MSEQRWTRAAFEGMNADEVYRIGKDNLKIPGIATMGDDEVRRAVIAVAGQRGLLIESDEDGVVSTSRATSAAPAALARVQASYPPHSTETAGGEGIGCALVGKTVAYAIEALRDPWSIVGDEHLRVYLNGEPIVAAERETTVLKDGDRLEMNRDAGEKGVR